MLNPFDIIIFGGGGDLALRKLLPAMYRAYQEGNLPEGSRILPTVREESKRAEYIETAHKALQEFLSKGEFNAKDWKAFSTYLVPVVSNVTEADDNWDVLKEILDEHDSTKSRVFYLSLPPAVYGKCCEILSTKDLITPTSRVVVEKPIGYCGESAEAINAKIAEFFEEDQIFRIDHYLGKETVQNLIALRFANPLFGTQWNQNNISHVEITVAEKVGIEGRWGYFDEAGQLRDMVQNHLMQLLCLIAMEPPARFDPDAVRDEKLKVIRALDPVLPHHIIRGQYEAEVGNEKAMPSYREAVGHPRSRTESFVALKVHISNWRWAGTPFFLRTGKRLAARSSEITVVFKDTPHSIFGDDAGRHRNVLSIRLQPNEGITLGVTIKEPGPGGMRLIDVPLDMTFAEALGEDADHVDAYERLIMDVMRGNQTLFMRGDEVEAAWAWTDPIIQGWEARNDVPKPYESGSAGPTYTNELMRRDGREWRDIIL